MARVDNITYYLVIVIVVYTVLAGGITAGYAGTTYETDENTLDLYDILEFEDSETLNISKPALPIFPTSVYYSGLNPERAVNWRVELLTDDFFYVESKGIGFPANLIWNNLNPEGLDPDKFDTLAGVSEQYLLDYYDTDKNYTRVVFNKGGQLETTALFSPQFDYNGTAILWAYENMTAAIDDGELTVTLGINATYIDTFDVNKVLGNMVGFGAIYNDMPDELNILISGVWWSLIVLLGVKLAVG